MGGTPPLSVFDIAGRAMAAQLGRINNTASNLANAGSVAGTAEGAYQPRKPVADYFTPTVIQMKNSGGSNGIIG